MKLVFLGPPGAGTSTSISSSIRICLLSGASSRALRRHCTASKFLYNPRSACARR